MYLFLGESIHFENKKDSMGRANGEDGDKGLGGGG